MRKINLGLVLVLSILLITACSKNKLVGKWKAIDTGIDYFYTFNEDKTCIYEMTGAKMDCTYEMEGKRITILYKGSSTPNSYEYKIDKDTLTLKDNLGNEVVYKK